MKEQDLIKLQQDLDNMNIVVKTPKTNIGEKLFGLFDKNEQRPFFTFISNGDFKKDLISSLELEIKKLKRLIGEDDNIHSTSFKKDNKKIKVNINISKIEEPKKQLKQLILLYQIISTK